jgi:hypothetical protein
MTAAAKPRNGSRLLSTGVDLTHNVGTADREPRIVAAGTIRPLPEQQNDQCAAFREVCRRQSRSVAGMPDDPSPTAILSGYRTALSKLNLARPGFSDAMGARSSGKKSGVRTGRHKSTVEIQGSLGGEPRIGS